jgi:hypothetical protein
MSYWAEEWAYAEQDVRGMAKQLLTYLGRRADDDGKSWPAVERMIRDLGRTERAIRAGLAVLVERGKVVRQHRHDLRGKCTSTLYWLPIEAIRAFEAAQKGGNRKAGPDPCGNAGDTPAETQEESSTEYSEGRKEERGAHAPALPPSPSDEFLVEGKEESRIEEEPAAAPEPPAAPTAPLALRPERERATPLPDDWQPSPEVRQMAIEAGWDDPDELREDIFRWEQSQPEPPIRPWNAFAIRWIRREQKWGSRGRHAGRRKPSNVAWMAPYTRARYAEVFGTDAECPDDFTGTTLEGTIVGVAPSSGGPRRGPPETAPPRPARPSTVPYELPPPPPVVLRGLRPPPAKPIENAAEEDAKALLSMQHQLAALGLSAGAVT